ncbi:MAG: dephospho-CoA kinase [Deltaproteobacteria bacterium]|nr:dephospho-CoA kinase [Deltaproteobacteria bacterium]
MKLVGLTGGIASGKSTVSRLLAEAGARIIDADVLARQAVEPGQPAFAAVVEHFGSGAAVAHAMAARLAEIEATAPESTVVLDVPLLFEAGMDAGLDLVVVVDAPEAVQLERLMKRSGLSRADALARIRSQMPMAEKRRRADVVIDNSGSLASTRSQVLALWRRLNRP